MGVEDYRKNRSIYADGAGGYNVSEETREKIRKARLVK
jgi:hypothetical protein